MAWPHRRLWLAPALLPSVGRLRLARIPIGPDRVDVEIDDDGAVRAQGLGADVELLRTPRQPLTATIPSPGHR